MINAVPYTFQLVARNEGKIKSYESCLDVRAWSHNVEARGGHLRAWIKHDMPTCMLSTSTLAFSLRTMVLRNRGRLTPRCHPNCKSKAVLESICTSCHAIKECLQGDSKFNKYFEEEEIETSHWPCDQCLEILKSIKMFWRIITEKVFHLSYPKSENLPRTRSNNVCITAKTFQKEIVQEALCVKNKTCSLLDPFEDMKDSSVKKELGDYITDASRILYIKLTADGSTCTCNSDKLRMISKNNQTVPKESKAYSLPKKVSRSISVKIKRFDVGCEATGNGSRDRDVDKYKDNLNKLQQSFYEEKAKVEKLKKENLFLKMELQNVHNVYSTDCHMGTSLGELPIRDALAYLPKPFEDNPQDGRILDDGNSEMVITMKKCRDSNSKQVSLLQVLHKSNKPYHTSETDTVCRREDPIELLSKIQTTFGAIVQREISLVGDKKHNANTQSYIEASASYHTVKIGETCTLGDRPNLVNKTCWDCQGC